MNEQEYYWRDKEGKKLIGESSLINLLKKIDSSLQDAVENGTIYKCDQTNGVFILFDNNDTINHIPFSWKHVMSYWAFCNLFNLETM